MAKTPTALENEREYDRVHGNLTPMAAGGVVTRPTRALIGEAGPEAVIPLGRAGFDTKALEAKLDGLRSDLRTMLPLAMRDALLTARGRA